ncbi:MAG: branched-chain amino acid ABC transporter permease [Hyphomonadaceae bacterium]|nr:branched-chain amino acid ABC transporter permease [Hyphomonadaceae bacterium]
MRQSTLLLLVLGIAALLAPLTGLYTLFLLKCVAFALFAAAFNFFTGNVGLLSIGHAAFFGMGAYAAGHVAKEWGVPTELTLVISLGVGAGLGIIIGGMAIRRQGIYFAMITLAMAQMIYFFCVQAPFTGAEDGLQRIPRGTLFGTLSLADDMTLYALVVVVALAAIWGLQRVMEAPFGHVLLAIRDNEARAISLGYDVKAYKLSAFVLSASVAGLAGGLKAITLGLASLPDVHWTMSGTVILMCLLGGLGTSLGPIVGAIIVITLESKLASMGAIQIGPLAVDFSTKVPIVIGLIFMSCVLLFRKGVVGELISAFERLRPRGRTERPLVRAS